MNKLKLIRNTLFVTMGILAIAFVLFLATNNAMPINNAHYAANTLTDEVVITDNTDGWKAMASGIAIGLAALGGTIAMGMAVAKSAESIARQPEADGKIRSAFMLGLVFIETVVIYALIVGILIIFVL